MDIDAGAELVQRIGPACKATQRSEMLSSLGGFAAMTALPEGYAEPVLVSGTDGVGTKLRLAIDHDRHDTVGQDLVAMCTNDVLVTGAEPLLFLDYYATGKLNVDVAERVIKGIAAGCSLAGCSLAGGETAEMPGFYDGDEYDLAGFCVGIVERDKIISGDAIDVGDKLIGLPSTGPHSNGYSLIRKVIERQDMTPDAALLDALLAPTRIYVQPVLDLLKHVDVRGMVHITGGGFYENIPRVLNRPEHAAMIDLDAWSRPDVFNWLQQAGNIAEKEMLTTFNCGIGFVVIASPDDVEATITHLKTHDVAATVIGEIVPASTQPGAGQIVIG